MSPELAETVRPMGSELVELEGEARAFRKQGRFADAIRVLSTIVQREPGWEHGLCHYEMAICYEGLGMYQEARDCFRRALSFEPNNTIYLGGLASHLYLHGSAIEAFEAHLNLLRSEASVRDVYGMEQTKIALNALAKKLGLSEQEARNRLKSAGVETK